MRVALDVSAVPARPAGAGRYVVELARRLPGAGVDTTLVSRRDDSARWCDWSPLATVVPLVPPSRVARLWYEAWSIGVSAPARAADVWHGPHYTMPHRGSTPCVVTVHDLTFFTNPEWHERSKVAFFRRAIVYSARHARVLVSVSDFTARQLDEFVPDHAPVVVAHHGVDLGRFRPDGSDDERLFAEHDLCVDVEFILFVGTLEPRKGLDVLLGAFSEVAAKNPSVELWLAGQSGWGVGEFARTLAAHPATSRIRRLGFVDDAVLPALFRRSAVVAYPSRGEGFGLPVLEALACGSRVVTSADTVMAEVAGATASLVPVGDVTALAGALDDALHQTPDERLAHGRAARERAALFTWDASIAQHLVAYDLARNGV